MPRKRWAWSVPALLVAASVHAQQLEPDVDRLGGDFDRVSLAYPEPNLCVEVCRANDNCVAFTYTPPGFNDYPDAQCWLKDRVPPALERPDAVSGIFEGRMQERGIVDETSDYQTSLFQMLSRCGNPYDPAGHEQIEDCYAQEAANETDAGICDVMGGDSVARCRASAGRIVMDKCRDLGGDDRAVCQMAVAVEYRAPEACDIADIDFIFECKLTVAAELREPDIVFAAADSLTGLERDRILATYAVMTNDFGMLDFIEDNRVFDQTLSMVAGHRVAAGLQVDSSVCRRLVGGYTSDDGGLGADGWRTLCEKGLILADTLRRFGETHTAEELLEAQDQLRDFMLGNASDDGLLPPDLRDALNSSKAVYASSQNGFTPSQSTVAPSPEVIILTEPSDEPPPTDGENCLLGFCN